MEEFSNWIWCFMPEHKAQHPVGQVDLVVMSPCRQFRGCPCPTNDPVHSLTFLEHSHEFLAQLGSWEQYKEGSFSRQLQLFQHQYFLQSYCWFLRQLRDYAEWISSKGGSYWVIWDTPHISLISYIYICWSSSKSIGSVNSKGNTKAK